MGGTSLGHPFLDARPFLPATLCGKLLMYEMAIIFTHQKTAITGGYTVFLAIKMTQDYKVNIM